MLLDLQLYLHELADKTMTHPMVVVGLLGQLIFMSRFIVQWIASERAKASVIPVAFWYLSLVGSLLVLWYGIADQDIVVILGQAFGFIVYIRNLYLIHTHTKRQPRMEAA